jgi:histo-blood group ABO system transferase
MGGQHIKRVENRDWVWLQEAERLAQGMVPYGMAPLGVTVYHRAALDALISPEWDSLFDADVFCELRLPSVIAHCGFPLVELPLPHVRAGSITPNWSVPGIYHAVKGPERPLDSLSSHSPDRPEVGPCLSLAVHSPDCPEVGPCLSLAVHSPDCPEVGPCHPAAPDDLRSKNTPMIRIALSTDAKGHPQHATLIASILRRTNHPVHVRCWCRGFLPESFETGPVKVEFIHTDEEVTGKFPGYVGPAVFDRLRVIRDATDWDKCLIMDYDQLALCDLAPLFDLDLGDHLLAAKMQGPGVDMAYAMKTWIKRPLPEGWDHVAEYPYFSMGPLLNLKAMREAGTWDKLMAAHAAFGVDEQLSLTAATEGRTTGFDRKWNLFPKSDISEGEVPEGVIHWLGWPKPWHKDAKVWRPDIWESEKSSWEHLRMGLWKKPLAIELEPEDDRSARALAQRGWQVEVFSSRGENSDGDGAMGDLHSLSNGFDGHRPPLQAGFPDLHTHPASQEEFQKLLERGQPDQVRIGAWEDVADWLEGSDIAPEYLVLKGGMDAEDVDRVRALGYAEESRLMSGEWPAGGPLPRALDFHKCRPGTGIGPGEDLYLKVGEEEKDGRIGVRLSLGVLQERPLLADAKKIGVCVIATSNYRMYVTPLLRSIRKNFLPGHEVTVFLFTNGERTAEPDLRVIQVPHEDWPGMSLRRYAIFREHAAVFEGMDYLFYMDADMRVIGKVGEEILSDLVGTLHPGFHDKPRAKFTYERRNESAARVSPEEGSHYFCGGFQGGSAASYLQAACTMAERIDADEAKGITAVWHDESHWNRYLIDHEPSLVLSPSYCWYPDGRSKDFEGKIAVVLKDAAAMRA